MTTHLPKKLLPFIWHFVKPYKVVAVIYVITAIIAGFWGPFSDIILKQIINTIPQIENGNIKPLVFPSILLVMNFIIFDNFTWRGIGYMVYKYAPLIKNDITRSLFHHVLGLSHQFFQDNLSGRLTNQINNLADNVEKILLSILQNFLRGSSVLITALIVVCFVHPLFSIIIFIWFIIFLSFSLWMSSKLVDISDSYAEAESFVSGQLVDSITNVSNIRIFAHKIYEISRINKFLDTRLKKFRKEEMLIVLMNSGQGALISIMLASVMYLIINLYGKNLVSIGDFVLILGISMEVAHMTWYTVSFIDEFNKASGKCKQSLKHLIVDQDIKDNSNAIDLNISKGAIVFNSVKFHYAGIQPLFNDKSITIPGGQKVGLVGYSGSGKSTFVNLILRLYDVTAGNITIDGQDICNCGQDSLRNAISIIPQDPSLFHRTLIENIRYGKIDASDEEVINAAKRAHAHEFIAKLPEKYESLVGERGVKLSGGQRQRIAIARAILKNSPILILDEATSQLDSITEHDIQESLLKLMKDKTTIVIAHRLSTLLHMDRILVFDQGKIVEDGTHKELLAKKGLYATLWNAQIGGFLPDKKG